MSEIRLKFIEEITRPTKRDKQRRVGPSELGNPCDRCLGRALMDERAEQDFSLYPWLGTAVHYYLEDHVFQAEQHELRLSVGEIPGYGEVVGTTDMWYSEEATVVDWKIVGLKKLKSYRVSGVTPQYRYQAQLYARGCELLGYEPKKVAIVFIPRDSGNVRDIWVHEEEYQPEMAEAALERAGEIYAFLQEGNTWQDLEEKFDCWQCNHNW